MYWFLLTAALGLKVWERLMTMALAGSSPLPRFLTPFSGMNTHSVLVSLSSVSTGNSTKESVITAVSSCKRKIIILTFFAYNYEMLKMLGTDAYTSPSIQLYISGWSSVSKKCTKLLSCITIPNSPSKQLPYTFHYEQSKLLQIQCVKYLCLLTNLMRTCSIKTQCMHEFQPNKFPNFELFGGCK